MLATIALLSVTALASTRGAERVPSLHRDSDQAAQFAGAPRVQTTGLNAAVAQRSPTVGTGEIRGIVTLESTGSRIRDAQVTLSSKGIRSQRATLTDGLGYFDFQQLPAGGYTVQAAKPGYITTKYGSRKAGVGGTLIQLGEGETFDAAVAMPSGSVITGTLVDEMNEPSVGTQVRVFHDVVTAGVKMLLLAGAARTDDRGIYRLYGLQPGSYVVCVTPSDQAEGQQNEPASSYAPVYYPGTTTSPSAVPVVLATGEERTGIDFQVQLVPSFRVSGRLVSPDGSVPQATQVTMSPSQGQGTLQIPGVTQPSVHRMTGGQFVFESVPPGQYTISAVEPMRQAAPTRAASVPAPGGPVASVLWASADVTVADRDVVGLTLDLARGMTVSGHFEFHGTSLPRPSDLTRARVTIVSENSRMGQVALGVGLPSVAAAADGTFLLSGIPPGFYALHATIPSGRPPALGGLGNGRMLPTTGGSWTLGSAVVNGRDSLDFPFELQRGADITGAVLSFNDRHQSLTGRLYDKTGRPMSGYSVIVFPADKAFWNPQSRRIKVTHSGTDGSYTINALPPGEYRVAAATDIEQDDSYDTEFLGRLLAASTTVTIASGEARTQDLRLSDGSRLFSDRQFQERGLPTTVCLGTRTRMTVTGGTASNEWALCQWSGVLTVVMRR